MDHKIRALEKQIQSLSPDEAHHLYARVSGYECVPVSIGVFLTDPEYVGAYFAGLKHPEYWLNHFKQIHPSPFYSPYWLIVFRGAIGTAKSTYAAASIAYEAYKLLCLRDIHQALKRASASTIIFSLFNVTLDAAGDLWGKLETMMSGSPFFSRHMTRGYRRSGVPLFTKGVDFKSGSRLSHSIGKDIYCAILDEANYEISRGQTKRNFNSLIRRMQSRFGDGDKMPGKIFIISSETDTSGIVDGVLNEYRGQSGIYAAGASLWDVWPDRYQTKQYFRVYTGSDSKQPKLVTTDADPILKTEPEAVIKVPDLATMRAAFEADIGAALRDLAGVSTTSKYFLFGQRDKLASAFQMSPLFPDIFQLSFDDDTDQIQNHCLHPAYFERPFHPNSPRHAHIDIALSGDKLGIAASYVREFKTVNVDNPVTMEKIQESLPITVSEWAFSIQAKPGEQIPLYKIRVFIRWLGSVGYRVNVITADGYQSADMLQGFQKWGYKTDTLSMDRTADNYVLFRNALYEGRVVVPKNELLKQELGSLLLTPDGKKVDHPDRFSNGGIGSKDVSDAVGGSVVSLLRSADQYRIVFMQSEDYSMSEQLMDTFWS